MIRSVLYATDLSLYASYVLQHALAIGRAFKADVHVLHVVEPLGLFAESVLQSYLDQDSLAALHEQGLATVMQTLSDKVTSSFIEELDPESKDADRIASIEVLQGDPAHVILSEAKRLQVDLLVIGSHSYGAELETPLGRTADHLLQMSTIPVYLVPITSLRQSMSL